MKWKRKTLIPALSICYIRSSSLPLRAIVPSASLAFQSFFQNNLCSFNDFLLLRFLLYQRMKISLWKNSNRKASSASWLDRSIDPAKILLKTLRHWILQHHSSETLVSGFSGPLIAGTFSIFTDSSVFSWHKSFGFFVDIWFRSLVWLELDKANSLCPRTDIDQLNVLWQFLRLRNESDSSV